MKKFIELRVADCTFINPSKEIVRGSFMGSTTRTVLINAEAIVSIVPDDNSLYSDILLNNGFVIVIGKQLQILQKLLDSHK